MIADSTTVDSPLTGERARAFEPRHAASLVLPETRPGWDPGTERRIDDGRTLARMLGWASIGLGAAEVLAPERIAETLGVDAESAGFIRAMGLREIAQGAMILAADDPEPGIWARLAGDALDIGALGVALGREGSRKGAVLGALAFVAGVTALDALCAKQLRSQPD